MSEIRPECRANLIALLSSFYRIVPAVDTKNLYRMWFSKDDITVSASGNWKFRPVGMIPACEPDIACDPEGVMKCGSMPNCPLVGEMRQLCFSSTEIIMTRILGEEWRKLGTPLTEGRLKGSLNFLY